MTGKKRSRGRALRRAMHNLGRKMGGADANELIPFEEFVKRMAAEPERVIRNVFQVFHDLVVSRVGEGVDEYPDDPETIHYKNYDCSALFVDGADHPFFADRLFANRLMKHIEALRLGARQNKIYVFEGPHGSGKSTFLNNLLTRFEAYVNTGEGRLYETVWRFPRKALGGLPDLTDQPVLAKLVWLLGHEGEEAVGMENGHRAAFTPAGDLEVCCPSHDHPLLMIPKSYRRKFFDDVFENDKFKWKLFTGKEYEWVFQQVPCTICSSLYEALLAELGNPLRVLGRLYVRPYRFNRRLGDGISVFNPGDPPIRQNVLSNQMVQQGLNRLLNDSNKVRYIFSNYARTNNGIYALMDIKGHNRDRLTELHNIISEGVHKVEHIEENVNSLFFALMNPEDKKNIAGLQSFSDRIDRIRISYVLDLKTEVEIYKHAFGRHIEGNFLPMVLHNFARVIISSRLREDSPAMREWIPDPERYALYCDKNLQLLKMEIYTGYIPTWLTEADRRRLNARRRSRIIAESEHDGRQGFSGRDSISIFNEFYTAYARPDRLIDMAMLCTFFHRYLQKHRVRVPEGFLDSLLNMYDYKVLQEVKESLYSYNEDMIAREIQNYLFALNFEPGAVVECAYTGDSFTVSEDFLRGVEQNLLGAGDPTAFRQEIQRRYAGPTLTQEMMNEGRPLTATRLYGELHERYIHHLKERVLDPVSQNDTFRMAIRDLDKESFKTYDDRIKEDVLFLIGNLMEKFAYTRQGAKETCLYVLDNGLAAKFSGA